MIRKGIIKDEAFYNSFRYGLYALGYPVTFLIWTLIGTFVFPFGFWIALALSLVLTYLAFPLFYRGCDAYRVWLSDLKLLFRGDIKDEFRKFKSL